MSISRIKSKINQAKSYTYSIEDHGAKQAASAICDALDDIVRELRDHENEIEDLKSRK